MRYHSCGWLSYRSDDSTLLNANEISATIVLFVVRSETAGTEIKGRRDRVFFSYGGVIE
jgi:hypothetical protein